MSHVITGSDANFEVEVLQSEIPVLVDFWAEWCGPCRMIGPFIEQIAEESAGKVKVVKCNVDECPQIAQKYQITSIPTLILFKDGAPNKTQTGAVPLAQLKAFIQ